MKKLSLFLMSLFSGVFLLTSCLESGTVQEGATFGVVSHGQSAPYILKTLSGDFFTPSLSGWIMNGDMNYGDCLYIEYRYDSKLPENAPSLVELNGYLTVSILNFWQIDKYYVIPYLDTTRVLPDELPVISGLNHYVYIDGYMLIEHTLNAQDDLGVEWHMNYDPVNMMPTTANGRRYYDVFLRATVKKASDKPVKYDLTPVIAYDFDSFLKQAANTERMNLGSSYNDNSSTFTLRINFATQLDATTNAITWQNKTEEMLIAQFL